MLILKKVGVVKVLKNVRSNDDGRKKVDRHIIEYRDQYGQEYRRSFELNRNIADLLIPETIKIKELKL